MPSRGDLNGTVEVLQPCDKTVGVLGFGAPIKVVVTEIIVAGSIATHMIDGGEHRSSDRADGLFDAAAGAKAVELGVAIAVLLARGTKHIAPMWS